MAWFLLLLLSAAQFGQSNTGELRLRVTDPSGLPVQGAVQLISEANQISQTLETNGEGTLVARRLPFGRYRVEVSRAGFATFADLLEIQSAVPLEFHVTLSLATIETQVTVSAADTLLDLQQSGSSNRIGTDTVQRRITALPGRSLPDLVNTQPGWLLEANGILHPRGSEYQVQYVVDGLPVTDNRSPSFAPEIEADAVHSMNMLTGGYPAEYGRKLGGVIEVVTAGNAREGLHGSLVGSAGSFGTASGYAMGEYGWDRTTVSVSGNLARTDRYLDPPVEENFTNTGTGSSVALHGEREFSAADRLGVIVRHGSADFLVPNELLQEEAGQRQDRTSRETVGQISYQHIFSARLLGDIRSMVRSVSAGLSSNPFSTPVLASQDRGFREVYLKGTVSGHAGSHEWKAGIDGEFGSIRESFAYEITDPAEFDPGTRLAFAFSDRRDDREQSAFVQDQMRLGALTLNAGLRWDRYRLLVNESAVSPRVGLAWHWQPADMVLRASYDRAFQLPAIENLLLASSAAVDALSDNVVRLPVRPSLGHFYEVGFSKRLASRVRVDGTHFRRHMTNFADDDVLVNTGVSFPIAFRKADIDGTELKLEVPRWGPLSGFISYAHMHGFGYLPVTGGLLLGDEAVEALESTERFPITQDQRHTFRSRVSYQISPKAWVALATSYGSGLPVESSGDLDEAIEQYGERIVDRVDLEEGRVRPNLSFDASANFVVHRTDKRRISIQADVLNLANRLNVINFSGLFSGTALAAPRSAAVRVQLEF